MEWHIVIPFIPIYRSEGRYCRNKYVSPPPFSSVANKTPHIVNTITQDPAPRRPPNPPARTGPIVLVLLAAFGFHQPHADWLSAGRAGQTHRGAPLLLLRAASHIDTRAGFHDSPALERQARESPTLRGQRCESPALRGQRCEGPAQIAQCLERSALRAQQ